MGQITLATSGSPTFSSGFCTIDSTGSDRVTCPSGVLDNNQGWVAMCVRFRWAADATTRRLFSWRDTDPDGLELRYNGASQLVMTGLIGGEYTASIGYTAGAETTHVIIGKWTTGIVAISLDGSAFNQTSRNTMSTVEAGVFDIFRYNQGAQDWGDGDVFWFASGKGTLADIDAVGINAFGTTDPTMITLPGQPAFLWTADSVSALTNDVILPTSTRVRFNG